VGPEASGSSAYPVLAPSPLVAAPLSEQAARDGQSHFGSSVDRAAADTLPATNVKPSAPPEVAREDVPPPSKRELPEPHAELPRLPWMRTPQPHRTSVTPRVRRKRARETETEEGTEGHRPGLFAEFFAGEAPLTRAIRHVGVKCRDPDDLRTQGTDFACPSSVAQLQTALADWARTGGPVMLHFAPPCATFSRARDRSCRTRLRSQAQPGGIRPRPEIVATANRIATATLEFALWAVAKLNAAVSIENPSASYLWQFLEPMCEGTGYRDAVLTPCLWGSPHRKPTRLRCWGWFPDSLHRSCGIDGQSCGREHVPLEFGRGSTAEAAEYHPGLCTAWATEVAQHLSQTRAETEERNTRARAEGKPIDSGRVRRHHLRGVDPDSRKETKDKEDARALAGCRNPARLDKVWPELWSALAPVGAILAESVSSTHDLSDLWKACGESPSRAPPLEKSVATVRSKVARQLGLEPAAAEERHSCAPWRYNLLAAVQSVTKDPDKAVPRWLKEGAPMGIQRAIDPSNGIFPTAVAEPSLEISQLAADTEGMSNHGSFQEKHGLDDPPQGWTSSEST